MILYYTLGKASVTYLVALFAVVRALETSAFKCVLKLLKCVVPPDWVAYTATLITNSSVVGVIFFSFLVGK